MCLYSIFVSSSFFDFNSEYKQRQRRARKLVAGRSTADEREGSEPRRQLYFQKNIVQQHYQLYISLLFLLCFCYPKLV